MPRKYLLRKDPGIDDPQAPSYSQSVQEQQREVVVLHVPPMVVRFVDGTKTHPPKRPRKKTADTPQMPISPVSPFSSASMPETNVTLPQRRELGALPTPIVQCDTADKFFNHTEEAWGFLAFRDSASEMAAVSVEVEDVPMAYDHPVEGPAFTPVNDGDHCEGSDWRIIRPPCAGEVHCEVILCVCIDSSKLSHWGKLSWSDEVYWGD